jgi:hypothetical protein
MWGKYGRARQVTDGNIIRRMRFACWISRVTDTHSEHIIVIAFTRKLWLRESSSTLYVHCVACFMTVCLETRTGAESRESKLSGARRLAVACGIVAVNQATVE